jgi:hypothetical protein
VLAVVAGCTRSIEPPETPTTHWSPPAAAPGLPPVPTSGAYLGLWHKGSPLQGAAEQQAGFRSVEALARRPMAIAHAFYDVDRPFPTAADRDAVATGHLLLLSWNGRDTAGVAAGRYDALIRERARGLRALGAPVLLRWLWEMDGPGRAERAGKPASYVAAWRHLRQLFREEGADRVAWVWCPNAVGFAEGRVDPWYPGDDAVDWVCADGYNFGTDALPWTSFRDLFRPFVRWGVAHRKPLLIGEVGSVEGSPGRKAAWLGDVARALREDLPEIGGVVWFDEWRDGWDWRLRSSPSSAAAFAQLAQDPAFRPTF